MHLAYRVGLVVWPRGEEVGKVGGDNLRNMKEKIVPYGGRPGKEK